MSYETLGFEVRDGVARITLDRPKVYNAMNLAMMRELMAVSIRCDEDPAIRAVILTGTAPAFCGGGDLAGFNAAKAGLGPLVKEMTIYFHGAVSRFARMNAPLIVAVNGIAAGGGMSLAISGDLVLAAAGAKFTMAYTRAALTPDGSSTFYLARLVGLRRAQELVLTNRTLSAEEAHDWGLVTRVVADADLGRAAADLAAELAAGPTLAFGAAKRLLIDGTSASLETQMEAEARGIADMARTADTKEGVKAFLEKRAPSYRGA